MVRKIVLTFAAIVLSLSVAAQGVVKIERKERKEIRAEKRELRRSVSGEIQISGAFALYPMMIKWVEEFNKIYPKVKIDVSAGGAGKGITDALSNVVDLGMVSRNIYPAEIEKGAFVITVAKDAVVATINSRNPLAIQILTKGLTQAAAKRLWRRTTPSTWGDVLGTTSKIPIHVYTRADACGAAETWAAWLNCKQEDLEGTAVFSDPGVASAVQRDKIGIGFNNIAYAYDLGTKKPHRGIMVMPIDANGNGRVDLSESFYGTITEINAAIADGRYPAPPARELFLVCKGVPTKPEVVAFLEFILTLGQHYTIENGYVPLSDEKLQTELDKIDKQ